MKAFVGTTSPAQTNLTDGLGEPEDAEIDLDAYLRWLNTNHPAIAGVIADVQAISPAERAARIRALQACAEFSAHGRGNQWATTIDHHLEVRKAGASTLLSAPPNLPQRAQGADGQPYFFLDVFGGAGFIAQFARDIFGFTGTVITSDPSALMVRLTLNKNLPTLWQRAQDLLMTRDDSLDAVLFAYGTHHVPIDERLQSFKEAWRVLKPGGVLLFHDFPEQGAASRWFAEIVDRYTFTGHKHAHFSAEGVADYYTAAGFHIHSIGEIDDCFQFVGSSREAALREAIEFMGGAYGLEKLEKSADGTRFLWEKIQQIFPVDETPVAAPPEHYRIVIHRPALLGVGIKPR
jgi:ubiquinone/menaquinone biosynthesis C-methylase UbiE